MHKALFVEDMGPKLWHLGCAALSEARFQSPLFISAMRVAGQRSFYQSVCTAYSTVCYVHLQHKQQMIIGACGGDRSPRFRVPLFSAAHGSWSTVEEATLLTCSEHTMYHRHTPWNPNAVYSLPVNSNTPPTPKPQPFSFPSSYFKGVIRKLKP